MYFVDARQLCPRTTRTISKDKSARMLRQLGPYYCFIILFNIYMCIIIYLFKRQLLSSRYVFSYHPFYFDFHSAHIIFDVSSGFYFWNVNRTPTWHLSKMFKFAFKYVCTKNSEPTYWTILFVMLKIYFIYKVAGKKSRRAI
jgi:hypothetical protein